MIIFRILFKFIWHQYLMNLEDSSIPTSVILLNSGNTLVDVIGSFIKLLIEKLESTSLLYLFHGRYLGTLVRKEKAKILLIDRR